ncbi:MAG: glycosyltransferase family 2 protein [Sulfolobales archaeon]
MLDLASTILCSVSAFIILSNSILMLLASLSRARPLELSRSGVQSKVEVAIVVPAYREGPFIHYVIQSLKEVDYPKNHLKLVIVGEEDDVETYREIEKLCDVRSDHIDCGGIRGIYIVNTSGERGKPAALNFALKYVDADIIGFYDAEDLVHPKHVSIAVELLEDSSVAAVQFVREVAKIPGALGEAQAADFYFYYMVLQPFLMRYTGLAEICGSAFFIKSSLLKETGGFNTNSPAEDLDLTYRLGALGLKVLLALPPSTTRPIASTSSLIKQRARWIRGGILSIPTGFSAAPRSIPLMLITGFMPITTVTSSLTLLLGVVALLTGSTLTLSKYAIVALVFACVLGASSVLASNLGKTRMLRYLAIMSFVYYLASWRALVELFTSPRSWTKSQSKA